ncbi:MAG TPA: DUF6531 domain-containing protein [Solirubrobacteraceae bacterium]|nr:DUF6531 domain-containing protein [Solirubrobacteraceae bacterium]
MPDAQSLLGQEAAADAEVAERASPDAVVAREESQAEWEGLGTSESAQLAARVFPGVIDDPDGGSPPLPVDARVTGFASENVEQVALADGRHVVVESMQPVAVRSAVGGWSPVDLGLREAGGVFEPVSTVGEGVRVSKRLQEGVSLPGVGVSLTPVDSTGAAVAGAEGQVVGAAVFFGGVGVGDDVDMAVKPTPLGFDSEVFLRSVRSPEEVVFRVGMPQGASLVQAAGGSGVVQVVEEGTVIASVLPPSARDAAGTNVPVSMTVSGDLLKLSVDLSGAEYQFPIAIDPYVKEDEQVTGAGKPTNWKFCTSVSSKCEHEEGAFKSTGWGGEGLVDSARSKYVANETAAFIYQTQGESHIYYFQAATAGENEGSNIESVMQIVGETEKEGKKVEEIEATNRFPNKYNEKGAAGIYMCPHENCTDSGGTAHNLARFQQTATGSGEHFSDTLWTADVEVAQQNEPTTPKFNKTESNIAQAGNRVNVLYGAGAWLGPSNGAFEVEQTDPGIGISFFGASLGEWHAEHAFYEEGKCSGIQCFPKINEAFTYSSKMPNGEDVVYAHGKDLAIGAGYGPQGEAKIKVDGKAPEELTLSGLPTSGEIDERPYTLEASAKDGSGSTKSSGIASLALAMDGQEITSGSAGSCESGPCKVSGKWTINGESFAAGQHTLMLIATDHAGNVEVAEYPVVVHRAPAVSVGPGSVNLTTGEFDLSATDASIPSGGPSLAVSRSYSSRHLTVGTEGPLGPQWSFSLGSEEKIDELPNGSMVMVGSNNGETIFWSNGSGGFDPPLGDKDLSLTSVKEGTKITELLLKDSGQGTTTRFTKPSGSTGGTWVPTVAEGVVATGTVTYTEQTVEVEGKKITEPTEALAPVPPGISCAPKLERGCRALTFLYAKEKTATGEGPKEWGEYNGRLMQVDFTAWNLASKEMTTTAVAQYAYDNQGRLRAEWDPRISPSLKTTYGYDSEGHVTVVSPPGREPWLAHYGSIAGEGDPGRLLSVIRPAATTTAELKSAEEKKAPVNTVVPTLSSSSLKVGVKISVATNGSWSNSPLVYEYVWETCNSSGEECTLIAGAVNQSYYPASSDEGHKLRATVLATNADGTVSAQSAVTSVIASGTPNNPAPEPPSVGTRSVWTIDYQVPVSGSGAPNAMGAKEVEEWGQEDDPEEATAMFPPDKPMGWPAKEYTRATIRYLDSTGRTVNVATPAGGIATTEYNETNDVRRSLSADNRAAALKEGCESKEKCKSAEVSKRLDTESNYNEEGTQLIETLGPEHTVKLEGGSEVQARNRIRYFYENGLVIKTIDGAYIPGQEERNQRVTTDSYSGQNGLGWTLREPTSVTTDPKNGLENILEYTWGHAGSENGQFSKPRGVAVAANGNVYVVDTNNSRVEEFSSSGGYMGQFGKEGKENGQLKKPEGIAVGPNGDVYIADTGNNRVEIFSESGGYVGQITAAGTVKLSEPVGVAVAANGNIYVLDAKSGGEPQTYAFETNNKSELLARFDLHSEVLKCSAGAEASHGIAVSPSGYVYVVSAGNNCVMQFGAKGEYLKNFGVKGSGNGQLKEPDGIAVAPDGGIYVADTGNNRVEQFSETGGYVGQFATLGEGEGEVKEPAGLAIAASGDVYVADTGNSRMEKWGGASSGLKLVHTTVYDPASGRAVETLPPAAKEESKGNYTVKFTFGKEGKENGEFAKPHGVAVAPNGDVYVVDTNNSRVQEFSSSGGYLGQFGKEGKENGQLKKPEGIAVGANGDVYVADTGNNRIEIFNEAGTYLNQITHAGTVSLSEPVGVAVTVNGNIYALDAKATEHFYAHETNEKSELLASFDLEYTSPNCTTVLESAHGIAVGPNGDVYIVSGGTAGNDCVTKFEANGNILKSFGTKGSGNGQLKEPSGIAVAPNGDVYVADTGNNRVEEFNETGTYLGQFGTKGTGNEQFQLPDGIAVAGSGDLWNGTVYVADTTNNRIDNWIPPAINTGAHATQTIYYTAQGDPAYPQCNNHPEWEGLPCQTQPTNQPENSLPALPVTTITYNMWDEPETTTETIGSITRTKTETYDNAGRELTGETTSTSSDKPVPKVTNEYGQETGGLIKQSTTVGEKTETITSTFNTLGQLASYTDAEGNVAAYTYDVDGRIKEMTQGKKVESLTEGEGKQTYTYSTTTGELTKLEDPAIGTLTAGYDVEGKLTTEGYPNGMTATYTYNQANEATGLTYTKTAHCGESCTWFKDTIAPSIHGEMLTQASSLASETYSYDNAGRLSEVQETPTGKGCSTRLYAYDEESNRLSLTTRAPGSKGECATEGGTVEPHSYDEGSRLEDAGVAYESLGNATDVPAADAGGHELTNTYYADGQTASESQNEQTISYTYDPAGRTLETIAIGTTNSTAVSHYNGPGNASTWISEGSGSWTREIPGIGGGLVATIKSGSTATLQLQDLQGNIVATAGLNETETKLLNTYNSTEYGVPTTSSPPKFSWLGAEGIQTELPSGIGSNGSISYVPQLGRMLQTTAVIPPGAAPNGTYSGAPYTTSLEPWAIQSMDAWGAGGAEREAQRQQSALIEAERKAAEARAYQAGESPEPEEGGVEEGGLCEGAKALWCDEYGVETGQLPSGTDPYIGHGVYVAFVLTDNGLKIQVHFNEADSKIILAAGVAGAATVVAGLLPEDVWWAGAIASIIAGYGAWSLEHIEHHNCIGAEVYIGDKGPKAGYYRSKKECG